MTAVFICTRPARDAVAAGADLLDQLQPHWNSRVEEDLDVEDANLCPAAQAYECTFFSTGLVREWLRQHECPAHHPKGVNLGGLIVMRARTLGFDTLPTPGQEDDYDDPGNRDALNQRWREEVYLRNRVPSAAWVLAA